MIQKKLVSDSNLLLKALERLQGQPVLVVGDIMLDRYVWGGVDRISAEAPVPVVDVKQIENRLGGAANVAHNLSALGAKPTLCGFVGDDLEGKEVLALLESLNVSSAGIMVDRQRPTSLKTRIISQRQQMLRIDRESRNPLPAANAEAFTSLVDTLANENNSIVVSDYGKGVVGSNLMQRFSQLRANPKRNLSSMSVIIDPHPVNFNIYSEGNILKPNRKEAEQASGIKIDSLEKAEKAAQILIDKWKARVIFLTLGEDGVLIYEENKKSIVLPTVAREVFDVSGAGDTVTAVLSASLAAGDTLAVAGELANVAAGIVVAEVGTVAVTADKIRKALSA